LFEFFLFVLYLLIELIMHHLRIRVAYASNTVQVYSV
jgi:hypothetical protein